MEKNPKKISKLLKNYVKCGIIKVVLCKKVKISHIWRLKKGESEMTRKIYYYYPETFVEKFFRYLVKVHHKK